MIYNLYLTRWTLRLKKVLEERLTERSSNHKATFHLEISSNIDYA